jgi:hypothetical protein
MLGRWTMGDTTRVRQGVTPMVALDAIASWLHLQSRELLGRRWQLIGRSPTSLALRKPLSHPVRTAIFFPPRTVRYVFREMFTSNGFGNFASGSVNASSPQGMQFQADVHFLIWREMNRMKADQASEHVRERGPEMVWPSLADEALAQEATRPVRATTLQVTARQVGGGVAIEMEARGREARAWARRLSAYLARTSDAELRIAAREARK